MIGIVVGVGALITFVIRWRRANVSQEVGESVNCPKRRPGLILEFSDISDSLIDIDCFLS
jgi:hypothetical protein